MSTSIAGGMAGVWAPDEDDEDDEDEDEEDEDRWAALPGSDLRPLPLPLPLPPPPSCADCLA